MHKQLVHFTGREVDVFVSSRSSLTREHGEVDLVFDVVHNWLALLRGAPLALYNKGKRKQFLKGN